MTSTDSDGRHALITGLRQLADYLETHPALAGASWVRISAHADSTENGGRPQVDQAAAILGVTAQDDTPRGGHYYAERDFGLVTYCVVAIPDTAMDRYRAETSYRGCVIP